MGASQYSTALSWSHLHGIGQNKRRLKLGYGLRFTSYFGSNQNYLTAPAKYTAKESSIDTLKFTKAQSNALNISLQIVYSIHKKIDLGFNIDLTGLSFGGTENGAFISSIRGTNDFMQKSKPSNFNLLLTGDNDIGNLNSEFYVRYWVNSKIGIRAGLSYLFTEYTTSNKINLGNGSIINDRFRNKTALGFIAVSIKPF